MDLSLFCPVVLHTNKLYTLRVRQCKAALSPHFASRLKLPIIHVAVEYSVLPVAKACAPHTTSTLDAVAERPAFILLPPVLLSQSVLVVQLRPHTDGLLLKDRQALRPRRPPILLLPPPLFDHTTTSLLYHTLHLLTPPRPRTQPYLTSPHRTPPSLPHLALFTFSLLPVPFLCPTPYSAFPSLTVRPLPAPAAKAFAARVLA